MGIEAITFNILEHRPLTGRGQISATVKMVFIAPSVEGESHYEITQKADVVEFHDESKERTFGRIRRQAWRNVSAYLGGIALSEEVVRSRLPVRKMDFVPASHDFETLVPISQLPLQEWFEKIPA